MAIHKAQQSNSEETGVTDMMTFKITRMCKVQQKGVMNS